LDLQTFRGNFRRITEEVESVVIGQERIVELLLTAVLAEGHVILTGVPGLGRTLIAETIGRALGLKVSRIQFTPDLLPTDVTGTEVVEMVEGAHQYRYIPGPVFANMILADEINRAPARTQSALLEAMQEKQVTASGRRYPLEAPFLVVATQNTLETEGVYPLPEAQLDRFMMQIEMDYPEEDAEVGIVDATTSVVHNTASAVCDPKTVVEMQQFAKMIPVTKTIKEFTSKLVRASRWEGEPIRFRKDTEQKKRHWWGGLRKESKIDRVAQYVRWGASPRAGQCLLRAGKISAIVKGRSYVAREDIIEVAHPILSHRVIPDHRAGAKGLTSLKVVERLVDEVIEETAPKPVSSRMKSLLVTTNE
jgi:MoxR-like ATPase